jgi:hypothetical protein
MMYALIQPVRLIVEWDGKEIGLIPSVLSIYSKQSYWEQENETNRSFEIPPWIKLVMRARIHAQFIGLDFNIRINCLIGIHAFKYPR